MGSRGSGENKFLNKHVILQKIKSERSDYYVKRISKCKSKQNLR